jgi:ElaB/YqjD/DUF883 family membrane-anchored ribosome-binding protein
MNKQLVDDLKVVLQEAEELLAATAGASGNTLDAARRKLSDGVDLLRGECAHLQRKAAAAARASGQLVKEHPYETAGAGLTLMAIVAVAVWLWQRPR